MRLVPSDNLLTPASGNGTPSKQDVPAHERRPILDILPPLLLCIIVFLACMLPSDDGDVYWHIRTGQWIWEHKSLPVADPFSYTVSAYNPFRPDSTRIPFILHQYWLAQLLLFGIWNLAGLAGIIIFKAIAISSIIAFIYWWMRTGSKGLQPLVYAFLAAVLLIRFPTDRPQIFTYAFFPLLLYLLDDIRRRGRPSTAHTVILPVMMLLWANMHGGFILGTLTIFLYIVAFLARKSSGGYPWKSISILVLSVIASFVNPNGIDAFLQVLYHDPNYKQIVTENASPLKIALNLDPHFKFDSVLRLFPAYWVSLAAIIVLLVRKFKNLPPATILVVAFIILLSLSGIRYMVFLPLTFPLLISTSDAPPRLASWVAAAVMLAGLTISINWNIRFDFAAGPFFPEKAVAFIRTMKPASNIFNYYDWGGYMTLYLPERKVFVDGRGLVEEIVDLHHMALYSGQWDFVFSRYNINTVIVPGASLADSERTRLPLELLTDSRWFLVYVDDIAMVFVKNVPQNYPIIAQHALDKKLVHTNYELLTKKLSSLSTSIRW